MKARYFTTFLAATAATAVLAFSGCEKKGPAEKIGESIDEASEEIKDAVEKDGPVEEAGESIDRKLQGEE